MEEERAARHAEALEELKTALGDVAERGRAMAERSAKRSAASAERASEVTRKARSNPTLREVATSSREDARKREAEARRLGSAHADLVDALMSDLQRLMGGRP